MNNEYGFRFGNFYGSYYADEGHNSLGIEIGIFDVPNLDESKIAHTFSIALTISHFIFAIGYIISEERN